MNTKHDPLFIASKLEELNFLNSLSVTPFPEFKSLDWDYALYTEFKFKLMQHLRAECVHDLTEPVTKRTTQKFQLGEMSYEYLYQRQGLSVTLGNSLITYGIPRVENTHFEFFTTSGQSATLCALSFLKKEFPELNIYKEKTSSLYYESNELIDFLGLTEDSDGKCFFYDGSFTYSLNKLQKSLENAKLFIFDTTLFDQGSTELKFILEFLLEKKIPSLLVRSHLKLDSFGAEYSSLGSVAAINMDGHKKQSSLAKCLSLTGSYASIDQVYPFLGNPEFVTLSSNRNKRIQKFGRLLTDGVQKIISEKEYYFSVISTWHSYYFYLKYPSVTELNMHLEFEKLKLLSNVHATYCDSFGFDFLTLTCVPVIESVSNHYMYRFSCPDLSEEALATVLEFFSMFLDRLNKKLPSISQ